jgi:hypothetical protein
MKVWAVCKAYRVINYENVQVDITLFAEVFCFIPLYSVKTGRNELVIADIL